MKHEPTVTVLCGDMDLVSPGCVCGWTGEPTCCPDDAGDQYATHVQDSGYCARCPHCQDRGRP
jgi:hypothetical protein